MTEEIFIPELKTKFEMEAKSEDPEAQTGLVRPSQIKQFVTSQSRVSQ